MANDENGMPIFEIPDGVLEIFGRGLGLAPGEEAPKGLLDSYRRFKKMKDISGAGDVTPSEMLLLVEMGGYAHKKPEDIGKEIIFKQGDLVMAKWQGVRTPGKFIKYLDADECHVNLDGDDFSHQVLPVVDVSRQ